MTNKPMLSVERELLEKWASGWIKAEHHAEMRAILDKPAEAIPDKTVDAFSAWYSTNHYEDMSRATVGLMAFKAGAAYAESAAQHQGEPVAWMRFSAGGNLYRCNREDHDDTFPVYAEQPAHVPVVHTMKSIMEAVEASRCYTVLTSDQCYALAQSLNGVKP